MGLREDVLDMKKEVKEMKEISMAREVLKDYKRQNKRQFIIILVMLVMWFLTMTYLIIVLNKDNKETNEEIAYAQISNIKDSNIILNI